jgi:hypothetical protein
MTTQSRWVKMAGLSAKIATSALGLPFSTAASMLLEELVALSTENGAKLKTLEQKSIHSLSQISA